LLRADKNAALALAVKKIILV